jgi:hypothetical protein
MKNFFLQRAHALTRTCATITEAKQALERDGVVGNESSKITSNQYNLNYLAEHKAIGISSNAASIQYSMSSIQSGEAKTNDSVNHHLETTGTFVCV